jgi:hypothetical protein
MRVVAAALVLAGSFAATGCGQGTIHSGDTTATTSFAAVHGQVVTRDGSSDGLGGLFVSCPESGSVAITSDAGAFDLQAPAGHKFTVQVTDPFVVADFPPTGGCREGQDPSADAEDVSGSKVVIESPLAPGATCEISIEVQDGSVVESWVTWGDGDAGGDGEGEVSLAGPSGASGEIEVSLSGDCWRVEVEADGLSTPHVLTVALISPAGESAFAGAITVTPDGQGHLQIEGCSSYALPFGAATLKALAGWTVEVRDESNALVLVGTLPALMP